jgi:putative copper resistance protein D
MALAHVDALPGTPPSLSVATFFTEARLELLPAVLILGMGVLYAIGVRTMSRRGRSWPVTRTASFVGGLVALAAATQSGLASYDTTLFSAHVGQHVLLGIVAPFLLALGAPITLTLQAAPRPHQVGLLRVLRSRPVHALTNPIVAWCLFGLTLFVLYFTPLYELSLRNEVVHELVHLHFLVAGSVFFWAVIGLDPVAWRIPYGFRLLLVLLTVPFHAFLGLALMSATTPIAADYYASIVQPLGTDVLADQRVGAGIMWLLGDVIGVVAGVVVVHQWMQHEERAARRADAIDDRRRAMAGTA